MSTARSGPGGPRTRGGRGQSPSQSGGGTTAGDTRGRGSSRGQPGRGFADAPRPFVPRGGGRGAGGGAHPTPQGRGRHGGAIFIQDRQRTVDARIRDDSDKAAVAELHRARADHGPHGLPLRPDFGTQGRAIALRVNHFPVEVRGKIYRYGAAIALQPNSRKATRRIKRRVFSLAEQTEQWVQAGLLSRVAHDGAEKLVASFELPQPLAIRGVYQDEDSTEGGPRIEYTLTLTFEEEVDQRLLDECLAGQPVDSQALAKVLSALNLVLTAHPSHTGIKIGRDDDKKKHPDQRLFFDTPAPTDIGGGLTVRKGNYMSVRPAHQQLMVNVNTCHAAFYKPQNFADAMDEYRRFVGNTDAFGHHVRVTTRPKGHVVMIQGVSRRNAQQHKFKHDQHGLVTIEQFYERQHGIKLKRPDLPLLEGPNGSLYPPEVCDIRPDEAFKGELVNSRHATAMLNEACKLPKENAEEIVYRGLDKLGFRNGNPVLESFEVTVGTDMAVVPGRVLDKPGLAYSCAMPANIDDRASWNLRDVKFAVGARLERWAVLVIQDGGRGDFRGVDDPELCKIARGFCTMCNKSGMRMQPLGKQAVAAVHLPPCNKSANRFRDDAIQQIAQGLRGLIDRVKPELVLVMLSNEDSVIYDGLKRLCDVELDVATVCMQSSKVRAPKGQAQYFANVALKVNMKMGGVNHTLDANTGAWLKAAPTMIMGMDVTHSTGKGAASGAPSIMAVIASIDQYFAQYPAILKLVKSRTEIDREQDAGGNTLVDMFVSRFELYKARNNGCLPDRVIMFRDGVSESQYAHVREYELPQMKKAFEHFGAYQPKLSVVVCGKRHHTRFYPTTPEDAARDGNPLPGTVVDRGITPAYEFDFFLQPHASLKGTARPTHYFVVHDENGFTADDLQRVTNDLSYMFARATKAVSLVSPAYWADVACERGRAYLHKQLRTQEEGAGVNLRDKDKDKKGKKRADAGGEDLFAKAVRTWGNGVAGPRLKDTMFYL